LSGCQPVYFCFCETFIKTDDEVAGKTDDETLVKTAGKEGWFS